MLNRSFRLGGLFLGGFHDFGDGLGFFLLHGFFFRDGLDDLLLWLFLALEGRFSMSLVVLGQVLLEFLVVGEVAESLSDGFSGLVEGALMIGEFDSTPQSLQLGVIVGGSCVVEGECSGEGVQFLELLVAVVDKILSVDFLEEGGVFFNFGDFIEDDLFAGDFLDLLGFEIVFAFQVSYLRQFFVEVADLLLEGPQVGIVLFNYSLEFVLPRLAFLWLLFFLHYFKIIN